MTKEFKSLLRLARGEGMTFSSLFIASFLLATAVTTQAAVDPGSASLSRFGNLPLYFESNRGQTAPNVDYFARGQDHTVYLRPNGATIALSSHVSTAGQPFTHRDPTNSTQVRFVHMTLLGGSEVSASSGLEPLAGRVNYLLGNSSARWQKSVPTFAKVQYTAVYEGIDLVYYGNNQELEYDFYVAPKIDPSVIGLKFDGADNLRIAANGDLVLKVGANELVQKRPVAYQTIAGIRRAVAVRYQISDRGTVSFVLGKYDQGQPLVIDPILSYSTYIGGAKGDIGWAIAVDGEGRAYIAGDTLSIFKTLPTSGQQTNAGGGTRYGGDAFVARLDFDTNTLALTLGYLTYLGGDGLDSAIGIAVDADGAAYITGYTTSTNFPTSADFGGPAAFQSDVAGDMVLSYAEWYDNYAQKNRKEIVGSYNLHYPDAFVTKLDTNGLGVYSTYLGGELSESGADIAVDAAGAAYVVGYTASALTFIVSNRVETARCTNGVCGTPVVTTNLVTPKRLIAIETITNELGFLKATTNRLTSVVTNTLLSPLDSAPFYTGFPVANAIQTNNASPAFFKVYHTKRGDKPFVAPGTNVLIPDGPLLSDMFIVKLSPDATSLIYSTYLGGSGDDLGSGIGVALDGSASVVGWSNLDFPVTNAIQPEPGNLSFGSRDAVVAKLNPAGNGLVFSTYLGGRGHDRAYRVAVDAAGATFVAGATASPDFPVTPGALGRGGVFTSTNTSGSWNLTSSGLDQTTINALLADPFNSGTVYAGTARGVFKSVDGGGNWSAMNTGLLSRVVNTLAIEPLTGAEVLAGTLGGLYQSGDGGLNWTNGRPGLFADVRAIHFDSITGTNLFAGTSSGVYSRETFPVTNRVTFVSNDITYTNIVETNDIAWFTRNQGLRNRSVRVLRDDAVGNVYAGTDGGVYRSTNWGLNWSSLNKGLKSTRVRALVIDPVTPTTLYAGTVKGVHRLTDGTNWVQLTNGIGRPQVNALLIDPATPTVLYAGTTNGLFRSSDAGASWTLSQSNLSTINVAVLAFAPGSSDMVYAGTRSTNFFGGTNDAFLVKYSPDGLSYGYALTFGGKRNDEAWDVAVDVDGSAYVTGETASKEFPVRGSFSSTNSYQTNLAGKIDAFVAGFSANGGSNFLSFYHGGKKTDYAHSIALDPQGNAYIVGRTESSGLPVTNRLVSVSNDPLKLGGKRDAFVTKFLLAPPGVSVEPLFVASAGASAVSHVRVSWPASAYEFRLEAREADGGVWTPVAERPSLVNGKYQVTLPASASTLMFRLRM